MLAECPFVSFDSQTTGIWSVATISLDRQWQLWGRTGGSRLPTPGVHHPPPPPPPPLPLPIFFIPTPAPFFHYFFSDTPAQNSDFLSPPPPIWPPPPPIFRQNPATPAPLNPRPPSPLRYMRWIRFHVFHIKLGPVSNWSLCLCLHQHTV